MAKSESRHHGPRTADSVDDVEQSLDMLDKVLSEFDEKELSPQAEPESPSQGHQSEDDGYMSMNGRRAKFVPDFPSTDETSSQPPHPAPPDGKYSPPTPEEAERIISNLLPRISPNNTAQLNHGNSRREFNDWKSKNKINTADFLFGRTKGTVNGGDTITATIVNNVASATTPTTPPSAVPLQTTLPKARPTTVLPRYASLPSTSPPRLMTGRSIDVTDHSKAATVGIGISAVHDAVLRGIARMPEPIVNEHPVTIYPGRSSPSRRNAPRTTVLVGGGGRNKHLSERSTSQESSDTSPSSGSPTKQINRNNTVFNKVFNNNNNSNQLEFNDNKYDSKRRADSDDDRFSDDSLEDTSLPPPPPPPVVPPPPTLSAPVTPSKRHSIAWEINLDDPKTLGDPLDNVLPCSVKLVGRRRGRSMSGSQSSLASTPGQSNSTSNKMTGSSEWPDPPDIPICSTEDEAASIYSDSDELQIPLPQDMTGRGTYVIRKGRKQRQRLADLDSMSSSINSRLSEAGNPSSNCVPSPIFPASLIMPKSRHSIDLGASTTSPSLHYPSPFVQNNVSSLISPRSRLSLDLSSPTSELPQNNKLAATINNNNNSNTNLNIKSNRYTEFKTYSSTFDGLQALDTSNSNINRIGSNNALAAVTSPTSTTTVNITGSATTVQQLQSPSALNPTIDFPLMRVASLPAITPPLTGEILLATPRRELAPPLEEDEEMDSETQRAAPLREIENNISALLRGDIAVARIGEPVPVRRPVGFRPGVHKSESAKEMLLSQLPFGPLPATPPSSPENDDSDEFPPLPPSPKSPAESEDVVCGIQNIRISSHGRRHEIHPPAVPPHKGPSLNTLKTRSMDAGFSKSYKNGGYSTAAAHGPGTLPPDLPGSSSRRRMISGFPRRAAQSPREERRLQTSCSLPETPIFARGCDIPRTPHRRAPEVPRHGGSQTAPRNTTSLNSSIVGIAGSASIGARQRSISHALANGEMLRMAGGPARGWYPRQRQSRPVSTENLDRLHVQGSLRAWDAAGTASRKPLTLPPNLTPKFFNKSPREALRRVTSLLIRKGNGTKEKEPKKEREREKDKDKEKDKDNVFIAAHVHRSPGSIGHVSQQQPQQQKKKGFFKSFWKKSRHYSLEQ